MNELNVWKMCVCPHPAGVCWRWFVDPPAGTSWHHFASLPGSEPASGSLKSTKQQIPLRITWRQVATKEKFREIQKCGVREKDVLCQWPDEAVASCVASAWYPITSEDVSLLPLSFPLPLPLELEGTIARRPEDTDNSQHFIQNTITLQTTNHQLVLKQFNPLL